MVIRKEGNRQLAKNFQEKEFYLGIETLKATSLRPDEHYFDDKLISAVQFIRDSFTQLYQVETPIVITSTYRPHLKEGYHPQGMAVDFSFIGPRAREYQSTLGWMILKRKELFYNLRDLGIGGFGLYDTWTHLDSRVGGKHRDMNDKPYAFWNETALNAPAPLFESATNLVGKASNLFSYNPNDEDGSKVPLVMAAATVVLLMAD